MNRILELDGLRGAAILLVLYWHYASPLFSVLGNSVVDYGALLYFLKYSHQLTWSSVDLFFVLSGFLIVGILLDVKNSKNYFATFYIRRLCRIFPLYYLMLFLFILFPWLGLSLGSDPSLFKNEVPLLAYFSFTQNLLLDGFDTKWLSVTWSLAIEEQFYLFIPLLIKFVSRKNLLVIFIGAICMAPVFRFIFMNDIYAYVFPFARSDSILMGGCLAILIRNAEAHKFLLNKYSLLVFITTVVFIITAIEASELSKQGDIFNHLWMGLMYSLLLLLIILKRECNYFSFLKSSFLVWFGLRSYAIYLLDIMNKVFYAMENHINTDYLQKNIHEYLRQVR